MPYFKMVNMKFTCISYTNTFLVGRYWDFKDSKNFLVLAMSARVFHDYLVSLNIEGFDPQIFLNDPQNLLFYLL